MKRRIFFWVSATCAGLLYFQPPSWAENVDSGRTLYLKYCSSCHGKDGRGEGPVSPFLKVKVPDLTTLKKNNKGVFPLSRVMSSVDGSQSVRAHGEPSMPIWGEVFKKELKEEKYRELTTLHETRTIAEYL